MQVEHSTWLRSFATRVNLCISTVHVLELARWRAADHDRGVVAAEWIEALPYTWMRAPTEVGADEAASVLARRLGVSSEPRPVFVDNIFLTLDRGGRGLDGEVHATLPLPEAVRQARSGRAIGREEAVARESHQRLIMDRERADLAGLPREQRDRLRRALIRRIVAGRLGTGCELLLRDGMLGPDHRRHLPRVLEDVLDAFTCDPTLLPSAFVHATMLFGRAQRLDQTTKRPEKLAAEEMSANRDHFHADAAAAYCDVFTCDREAATSLGDARTQLGLSPPVAKQPGTPMAQSVEEQVDQVRGTRRPKALR